MFASNWSLVNDRTIRVADSSDAWANWCGVGPMNMRFADMSLPSCAKSTRSRRGHWLVDYGSGQD